MHILERFLNAKRNRVGSLWVTLLLITWMTGCDSQREPAEAPPAGGLNLEAGDSTMGGQLSAGHQGSSEAGAELRGGVMGGSVAGDRPPITSAWTTLDIFEGLSPTCAPCHSEGQSIPAFESLASFERLIVAEPAWVTPGSPSESALLSLLSGSAQGRYSQMPPSGPSYAERASSLSAQVPRAPNMTELADWIASLNPDALITPPEEVNCASLPAQSGLSRLSRDDYQRAVEDLLGTSLPIAQDLPAENESYHFTHLTELLTLSPLLVEKYDLAAQALAQEALPDRYPAPEELWFEGELDMESSVGAAGGSFWNLWAQGDLLTAVSVARLGLYQLQLSVGGGQAGPDPVRFAVLVDDIEVAYGETWAVSPAFERLSFEVPIEAGGHSIGVRFLNDYYCVEEGILAGRCTELGDRNLHFDSLLVTGPLYEDLPPSAFERRYLRCDLNALRDGALNDQELEVCGRETIEAFLRLAWRGPVSAMNLDRAWSLVDAELSQPSESPSLRFAQGLRAVVHAALLSPRFLFKEELTPSGEHLEGRAIATRLAALIWRSVPDGELLAEAESGALATAEGIRASVTRMLSDPRATRLAVEFGGRWLTLHHLEVVAPDYLIFPTFDEPLRVAMYEETRRVLTAILDEDRSILDLIDADFTYLSPRLASHYGLEGALDTALGDTFQRVSLPQAGRLGALTHGSWLTVTSHPTRTSPVVRGKWVLENLLCMPPPPPPPGVEGLPPMVDQDSSVRARLEQHRADPACAACHTHMDAIGYGFEQLDGVGSFRLSDAGRLIDPAGELPPYLEGDEELREGVSFADGPELVRALRADPRVSRCVAERFVVYALARGVREDERCLVDEVIAEASERGMTFKALVEAITVSPLFRMRGEVRP